MLNGITGILENFSGGTSFVLLPLPSVDKEELCRRFGNERFLFNKNFTVPVLYLQNDKRKCKAGCEKKPPKLPLVSYNTNLDPLI